MPTCTKFYTGQYGFSEQKTKMATTYATLTMGFIETQLYERFKEKYGQDEKENFVKLFKRFL
jgi:hypothetical protein